MSVYAPLEWQRNMFDLATKAGWSGDVPSVLGTYSANLELNRAVKFLDEHKLVTLDDCGTGLCEVRSVAPEATASERLSDELLKRLAESDFYGNAQLAAREVLDLRDENAELRKDRERLNWFKYQVSPFVWHHQGKHKLTAIWESLQRSRNQSEDIDSMVDANLSVQPVPEEANANRS